MKNRGTVAAAAGMKKLSLVTVTDTPGETKLAIIFSYEML
jgi:hypothetical protein